MAILAILALVIILASAKHGRRGHRRTGRRKAHNRARTRARTSTGRGQARTPGQDRHVHCADCGEHIAGPVDRDCVVGEHTAPGVLRQDRQAIRLEEASARAHRRLEEAQHASRLRQERARVASDARMLRQSIRSRERMLDRLMRRDGLTRGEAEDMLRMAEEAECMDMEEAMTLA